MVKIRLTRLGDKKAPFYRVVIADARTAREGKAIDFIGTYNPLVNPAEIKIDNEKAQSWLAKGAQPTETVRDLLVKSGAIPAPAKRKPAKTPKAKKESK